MSARKSERPRATALTRAHLRTMPLPRPDDDGDKDSRGRVLVVGGSALVPGAILLAGVAALRAGAGKLQLATVRSAAVALGVAVPEALVLSLPESRSGEIAGTAAAGVLHRHVSQPQALLIGPGISAPRAAHALLAPLVRAVGDDAILVLDAAAVESLADDETLLDPLGGRAVLTPHMGEMASLLGIDKSRVERSAPECALEAAKKFGAVIALKGSESWIATPAGKLLHYRGGSVGLATSGSGDTLAGVIAGLAARGADALTAAAWGVSLHGAAGQRLARRMGVVGFLARELLDEVPGLMNSW